jgi:hypothetical protein
MDLLKTYTHHSELQVVKALSLISTFYKSSQHPLSFFPAYVFTSRYLATASNSANSSASHSQNLSSQPSPRNWTLNWLDLSLEAIWHHPPSLLFSGFQLGVSWLQNCNSGLTDQESHLLTADSRLTGSSQIGSWKTIGLWEVEAATFSRQWTHRWRWRCQPYAPAALYPQEDS